MADLLFGGGSLFVGDRKAPLVFYVTEKLFVLSLLWWGQEAVAWTPYLHQ